MRLLRQVILILFLTVAIIHGGYSITARITRDNEPPVIAADTDEINVSVNVTDEEMLQGIRATDNKDGDVTDSLVVVSRLDFIKKGTLKVNYAAFDNSGNVGTYSRIINYTDYRSPRFSASKPFRFSENEDSATSLSTVTADDVLDGDLTADIRITYGNNEGTKYPVVLEVTNSAGDSAIATVNAYMEDRASLQVPSVALDQYIIYTTVGNPLDPGSRVIGTYQNSSTLLFEDRSTYTMDNVSWDTSGVDYNTPGEYVITYTLYNKDGEPLNTTEMYVIVEGD